MEEYELRKIDGIKRHLQMILTAHTLLSLGSVDRAAGKAMVYLETIGSACRRAFAEILCSSIQAVLEIGKRVKDPARILRVLSSPRKQIRRMRGSAKAIIGSFKAQICQSSVNERETKLRRQNMDRILITGGGGFIGSHLARYLYEQGHFVRVVDIKFDDYIQGKYYTERLRLDLRRLENCLKATQGIDKVYNLASNMGGIGFITSVSADIMRDNVLINTHMLEASVQNKVKKFLFSSSACVYPNYKQTKPEVEGLKEEDAYPADPNEAYGWEKLFTEEMVKAYHKDYGLDVRIVRYHNIYGPEGTYKGGREKAPAALCRKVAEASNPGTIEIWGNGKATRSFCYIDDCVKGTVALMESDYDKPLNIGSDRMVSVDELADIIIKISGKKITKTYNLAAPEGVKGRNADLTLVKKVLGWEPKVSLEEGLEKTYRWISEMVQKGKGKK
jgi:nucleoside-diphosphate-sugar epimerase